MYRSIVSYFVRFSSRFSSCPWPLSIRSTVSPLLVCPLCSRSSSCPWPLSPRSPMSPLPRHPFCSGSTVRSPVSTVRHPLKVSCVHWHHQPREGPCTLYVLPWPCGYSGSHVMPAFILLLS